MAMTRMTVLLFICLAGCQDTSDQGTMHEQLEMLGATVDVNEKDEIVGVELSFSEITDNDLMSLTGLPGLTRLYLIDTGITPAGLVHLKGLTSLKILALDNLRITDSGLTALGELSGLTTLYLGFTEITDAGLVHLERLTNLETLFLNNTRITDAGVARLKKTLPLSEIYR